MEKTESRVKRPRTKDNKRMMAWSNGKQVNIIPSIRSKVDDYGKHLIRYLDDLDEGYEVYWGSCYVVRHKCRLMEYEADKDWDQGRHLLALKEMISAATAVLPDDEPEFEDVQWLNPWEMIYWHPNIKEFIRLNQRCCEYCKKDPKLWPLYKDSWPYRSYSKFKLDLHNWRFDA